MSPSSVICAQPATLECKTCKQTLYCTQECSTTDKALYERFCKSFMNLEPRPSSGHVLIMVFSPELRGPFLKWNLLNNRKYGVEIGRDQPDCRMFDISFNPARDRNMTTTVRAYFQYRVQAPIPRRIMYWTTYCTTAATAGMLQTIMIRMETSKYFFCDNSLRDSKIITVGKSSMAQSFYSVLQATPSHHIPTNTLNTKISAMHSTTSKSIHPIKFDKGKKKQSSVVTELRRNEPRRSKVCLCIDT